MKHLSIWAAVVVGIVFLAFVILTLRDLLRYELGTPPPETPPAVSPPPVKTFEEPSMKNVGKG